MKDEASPLEIIIEYGNLVTNTVINIEITIHCPVKPVKTRCFIPHQDSNTYRHIIPLSAGGLAYKRGSLHGIGSGASP